MLRIQKSTGYLSLEPGNYPDGTPFIDVEATYLRSRVKIRLEQHQVKRLLQALGEWYHAGKDN